MAGQATGEVHGTTRAKTTWQVVSSRNVALYLVGNGVSNTCTWVYNVAAAILVYRLTQSTFMVGAVVFAQFSGTLLLAPLAGSAADRFNRRRLLMILQLVAAAPVAMLAVATALEVVTVWLVIGATALVGVATALSSPSLHAIVPLLVPGGHVDPVVALHSVTFQLARAIGPFVAAAVIAIWGLPVAIGVNAVSFLVFVVTLVLIRPRPQEMATTERRSFRRTAVAALRDGGIRRVLLCVVAVSMASDAATTLAPEFAAVLGRSDAVAGVLMGSFGAGSLLTGIALAPRLRRWRRGFVVAMGAEVIGIVAFALAPHLAIALAALAVAGGGFVGAMTQLTSRMHELAAPGMLGRFMALWGMAFLGTRPVAALIDGTVAEIAGVRVAALVIAIPVASAVALDAWRFRGVNSMAVQPSA